MHPGLIALITAAALLLGGLIWLGLVCWQRLRPLSARSLLVVLLVIGVVGRMAYVFFTPIFYAPDEQSHFNYIKYVSENGSLPVLTKGMGDPANEWEYHQPPLYYVLLVPVFQAANAAFHNLTVTVYALRLCSFILWALNIWLGLALLKRLAIEDDLLWLGVLALGCLLPTYTFVSSVINNDNLLITLSTAIIYVLTKGSRDLKDSIVLGALLGVGLWVKASAVVLFPAVALFFFFECFQKRMSGRTALCSLGTISALAILIDAPWVVRNWKVYGTFMPEGLSVAAKNWPSFVDGLLSAGHNLVKTFWSVSGISNDIGYPFPLLGMGYGLMAVAGLAINWKQNPKSMTGFWLLPRSSIYAGLGFAILVNVMLVLRLGYLYGMGQGRHLFPLLFPIALLLTWGLKFIPGNNAPVHVVGFWITYAIGFEAFSLSRFQMH